MFVKLEGTWHPMGEDETTVCGIVVPHGTDFVREIDPDLVHYGDIPGGPREERKAAAPKVIKGKKK